MCKFFLGAACGSNPEPGVLHQGIPGGFHVLALATPWGEKFQENGLALRHLLSSKRFTSAGANVGLC